MKHEYYVDFVREKMEKEDAPMSVEEMKERVKKMAQTAQETAAKLGEVEESLQTEAQLAQQEIDARSVFVGNVDFNATPEDLQNHFQACGAISRITILSDKWTGRPKGYLNQHRVILGS